MAESRHMDTIRTALLEPTPPAAASLDASRAIISRLTAGAVS